MLNKRDEVWDKEWGVECVGAVSQPITLKNMIYVFALFSINMFLLILLIL